MVDVERCGHAVTDLDGEQQPCDRVATGWRWYQDCEHEDTLERACDWHANEGGRRLHEAEAKVARCLAILAAWEAWDGSPGPDGRMHPDSSSPHDRSRLRAALSEADQ